MRQKSFVRYLDVDNRVRVSFQAERGRIRDFVTQYESFLDGRWNSIVRYDTAHGFAHVDIFHPGGKKEKIRLRTADFNEALTLAQEDIKQHWEQYLTSYLRKKHR